jgi:DNA-binding SARP family transcriptional activator/tetratricopeptide (TPR) repeat protein
MQVRVLGPVEVDVNGRTVTIRRRQERGLLAVLALDCGRLVPVERLTDLIWHGSPPADARAALQAMVSHLRAALDDQDAARRLVARGNAYLLDLDPACIDVHLFRSLLTRAEAAADPQDRAGCLGQALRLWRGPSLAGTDPRLRARLAPALDDQHVAAELDWLAARLDVGEYDGVLEPLTRLVADHPLAERPRELLMLTLHRAGRSGAALAVFRQGRAVLREELGLDPGPRLRAIEAQILAGDPAPAAPTVLPHRTGAPAELPAGTAGFIGRAGHLHRLDGLIADASDRGRGAGVIAITGGPGVGKTALAVHWAHRVSDRFPDGQIYLDLRGWSTTPMLDPADALIRILGSLGVGAARLPNQLDALAATYRTVMAERRILIVLDNASDAGHVRPLLPAAGSLVLVTSRSRLSGLIAREGASRLTLDVLTPDEAAELLAHALGPDRLGQDPAAVRTLVDTCARLPLALRLAAAQMLDNPDRTVAEQAAALRRPAGIDELCLDEDRDGAVRAAFDLSLARLPAPVRHAFRMLGSAPVHDFSLESAAAVAGISVEQARPLLDRLVGAHLVTRDTGGRVGMHDLLHRYAAELAAAEDGEDARAQALSRLLDFYLTVADRAARALYPYTSRLPVPTTGDPNGGDPNDVTFADTSSATAWLDRERDDMLAVIRAGARAGAPAGATPTCWLLADTLRGHLWQSGPTPGWLPAVQDALAAAERSHDLRARSAMHLSMGTALHRLLEYDRAAAAFRIALETSRAADWTAGTAAALNALGNLHDHLGHAQDAARFFTEALEYLQKPADEHRLAMVRYNLGTFCLESGDLLTGRAHLLAAAAIARAPGTRAGLANILARLGALEHSLGHLDLAEGHLQEALALTDVADRTAVLVARLAAAAVSRDRGEPDQAWQHADAAREIARQIGDPRDDLDVRRVTATLHPPASREAIDEYQAALRIAEDLSLADAQAEALLGLSLADLHTGDHASARTGAVQALATARRVGAGLLEGRALTLRAAATTAHDTEAAIQDATDAVALHRRQGAALHEAGALAVLAHAHRYAGRAALAQTHHRRALRLTARSGADPAAVPGLRPPTDAAVPTEPVRPGGR